MQILTFIRFLKIFLKLKKDLCPVRFDYYISLSDFYSELQKHKKKQNLELCPLFTKCANQY